MFFVVREQSSMKAGTSPMHRKEEPAMSEIKFRSKVTGKYGDVAVEGTPTRSLPRVTPVAAATFLEH